MLVKIAYQDQIHLFHGEVGIITLKQHCQKVFRCLPSSFDFFYTDEEGDIITMSTDYDIDAFKYLHGEKGVTKLYIHECIDSSIPASHDNSLLFIDVIESKQAKVQNQKLSFTQQDQEQVIKEQLSDTLQRMTEATAEKLVEEEKQMHKQEVRTYLEKTTLECAEKMFNQQSDIKVIAKYGQIAQRKKIEEAYSSIIISDSDKQSTKSEIESDCLPNSKRSFKSIRQNLLSSQKLESIPINKEAFQTFSAQQRNENRNQNSWIAIIKSCFYCLWIWKR